MKSSVTKQKSPHSNRKARILVLQALYEVDSSTHTIQECLTRLLLEQPLSKGTSNFAKQIAYGIESFQNSIDELIKKYAPSYPLNQLSPIDRNILRITIYEILFGTSTPPKAAINEAIEIATKFGSTNAPKFINGVLGSIMVHLEHKNK
jgi:N utilization substance protein B